MLRKRSVLVAATFGLSLLVGALPATATTTTGLTGYDISWPQCSGSTSTFTGISTTAAFAILGVNDGKANTTNPCLQSQITQATGLAVSFYQNTANPGSRYWPAGQQKPAVCPTNLKHLNESQIEACSEDYGYNAAQYGYMNVLNTSAGPNASSSEWWLDVESANSWSRDPLANIADIQGGLLYLKNQGVTVAGIYTNSSSWSSITGSDTTHFTSVRWWAPGLVSSNPQPADLSAACATPSLFGGSLHPRYVQYTQTYDTDYDCG
ncbi:MAG: hypothetical protein NVS3B21_31880 [Acidimicrobiales bacterium]